MSLFLELFNAPVQWEAGVEHSDGAICGVDVIGVGYCVAPDQRHGRVIGRKVVKPWARQRCEAFELVHFSCDVKDFREA
jgi:hypothetical protein